MRRLLQAVLLLLLCVTSGPAQAEDKELTVEEPPLRYVSPGDTPRVFVSAVNVADVTVTVRRVSQVHAAVVSSDRTAPIDSQQTFHLGPKNPRTDGDYSQYIELPVATSGTWYYRIDGGNGHFAEGLICVSRVASSSRGQDSGVGGQGGTAATGQ